MNINQHPDLTYLPGRLTQTFILIIVLAVQPLAAACSGDRRELTRARAQELILQDAWIKKPAVLQMTFNSFENSGIFSIYKEPADESREEAEKRVVPEFLKFNPRLAAARHLGMITIEPVLVHEAVRILGSFNDKIGWGFQMKIKPTEAGLALAKEMALPESETEIPLATKKFVEINAITKLAENQAKADFVWVWVPNRLAKALDASTAEFKALPPDLQAELLGKTNDNLHPQTENWTGERRLSALFQRYDDGWRLVRFW